MSDQFKERLAAIEHQRWADWQSYVHSKCYRHQHGLIILAMLAARWERQIATPYADLTEEEKRSDREQVDRYWPLIVHRVADVCADRDTKIDRLRAELAKAAPVLAALSAWRDSDYSVAAEHALKDALDAYTAGQDNPGRASGRTGGEGGAGEGVTCTCPELRAGTRRTGSRNLSPSCPQHGEGTQWWRDFWAAQAALGSPRERAERLAADMRAAVSGAGQAVDAGRVPETGDSNG